MKKYIYLSLALSLILLLPVSSARAENSNANTNGEEAVTVSTDSATIDSIAYYESLRAQRAYQMDSMQQAMLNRSFQHNQENSSGSPWRWVLRFGALGAALIALIIRLSTRKK